MLVTGTWNAIFMLRMLSERAIQMQKDMYLWFIDDAGVFNKVCHKDLNLFGKDIRINNQELILAANCMYTDRKCVRLISKDIKECKTKMCLLTGLIQLIQQGKSERIKIPTRIHY